MLDDGHCSPGIGKTLFPPFPLYFIHSLLQCSPAPPFPEAQRSPDENEQEEHESNGYRRELVQSIGGIIDQAVVEIATELGLEAVCVVCRKGGD